MRDSLEEDAAYITPIGQDAEGNFVYAPEDKEILAELERQRMRQALERKRQQQEQRLRSSWRRFPFVGQENNAAGDGVTATALGAEFVEDSDGKNEESGFRRSTASSSSPPPKYFGCCSLRVMIVTAMIFLILLLVGLALIVTQPMWMSRSSPSPPSPPSTTKDTAGTSPTGGFDEDDEKEETVVLAPYRVEVDASTYTYDAEEIVVSFSKNDTYIHDFIGIYEALGDDDEFEDQEPLLSLRCCGTQGCFQPSDYTSNVIFGEINNPSDRIESWPLPVGRYHARLYQIKDGKRTVRLLAQTAEPFEVVPNSNGQGPTLPPKPQYASFPYLSLANTQLREKILDGEEDGRFVIDSNPVVGYPDDWIGVYRTTTAPVAKSSPLENDDGQEEEEPALWFYRCGFQDCFKAMDYISLIFDQKSTAVAQHEAWPLSWGTYQVKMKREYGTVLVASNPQLIVVYPGGLTPGLYPDKTVYEEGETIHVYFNNGFRDGPTGTGPDPNNPKNRNPEGGPPGGFGKSPREWIGIFNSTDNVIDGTVMPQFFMYTCMPLNDCTGTASHPYNGRAVFNADTVTTTSVMGTWPLPPGLYKMIMVRGSFPWDVYYKNYTRIEAFSDDTAASSEVFEVI